MYTPPLPYVDMSDWTNNTAGETLALYAADLVYSPQNPIGSPKVGAQKPELKATSQSRAPPGVARNKTKAECRHLGVP